MNQSHIKSLNINQILKFVKKILKKLTYQDVISIICK